MNWFYLDSKQEQQAFEDSALAGLIGSGAITGETLVWNESLPNWTPAAAAFPSEFPAQSVAEVPEIADAIPAKTAATSAAVPTMTKRTGPTGPNLSQPKASPLAGVKPASAPMAKPADIEHVASVETIKDLASYLTASAGWMKLLGGLSIFIGVVYCLTIIGAIIGWLPIWIGIILNKTADAARYAEMTGDQEALAEALDRLRKYFKIFGILALINLIIVAVQLILFFIMGGIGLFMGGMQNMPSPPVP